MISTAKWTGLPLAAVLDLAGARAAGDWLALVSADGYVEYIPMFIGRRPSTVLAYAMNGEPLAPKHGFPLRLIATGSYGMKNPKWLTKISVERTAQTGHWQRLGWETDSEIATMARFDTRPKRVSAGLPVDLRGIAFAGDLGVTRVEVSADGGRRWSPATIEPPPSAHTWVRWSLPWRPLQSGATTLTVRATNGSGVSQPSERLFPYPSGAKGYHSIEVAVE